MSEPSTRPKSKTELLERMRAGREEWDALIAQIPDSARIEPALAGGWSVKDLIAHVAAIEAVSDEDIARTGAQAWTGDSSLLDIIRGH
jgi:hypothetical protein